jgi:L-ascorbate metabolism protein UlaG (beta-lactamase superfamily)
MSSVEGVITSDHFDGQRFFNPTAPEPQPFTAVPRMLLAPKTPWPTAVDSITAQPAPLGDAAAVVTAIGHSTFLIQTPAVNILTDPIYSERAGPFNLVGPRRVRKPAVAFDDLPPIGMILLSHNHYDHCDRPTLRRLARRFDPVVITPLGNAALVRSTGLRRVEELDWWEASTTAPLPVVITPAHHFSARTPFDRNRALWGGFFITAGSRRIYFAGDTAYVPFFREIRQRLGSPDLALLPIGAYEPRWFMKAVHMNPAEAVHAHVDLESAESIGMHFGTFQLTTEGIDEPVTALGQALKERDVPPTRFRTIGFGASVPVR